MLTRSSAGVGCGAVGMVSSAGCGGGIVCVPAGANLAGKGETRLSFTPFCSKIDSLPRQARDKHKASTQNDGGCVSSCAADATNNDQLLCQSSAATFDLRVW